MLAANIETEIRKILKGKAKAGWLRVGECAKEYARDPETGGRNGSRETAFYRWRKKVEKGKVEGFQVLKLPGNILRSVESGLGFFDWLERRAERKERQMERKRLELRARMDARWEMIESGEEFSNVKFAKILHKCRKKYGLK